MESRMFSAFNNSNNAHKQAAQQQQQQQCRPSSDSMDIDDRGAALMSKVARTGDSSALFMGGGSTSQAEHAETTLRMLQMSSACAAGPGAVVGSLVRSNSMLSDGRLNCSPADSSTSDGAALFAPPLNDTVSPTLLMPSDHHLRMGLRSDSVASMYDSIAARALYHYPHSAYSALQNYPAGLPLGMVSAGGSSNIQGLTEQELVMSMLQSSGRAFTPGQLRELQHQALVLKYITNGLNVPQDLVTPIRASLSGLSPAAAHLANLPWGGYRLGFGANADPEPGRCRRTDGKKWRCSRDVVPDQKYCERHIHRGRHRTRKPMDGQQVVVAASSSPVCVSTSASGSASAVGSSAGILSTIGPASATVQPMTAGLTARHYSAGNSPTASCLSVGSSLTASHYNQLPSLHSSPGAGATMSSKDYRYISNMSRNDLDMGAEQMLFGEASGSSRGMGSSEYQSLHHQQSLAMLSSVSNSWRATPMQQSRAPSPSPSPHPSMKSNTSSPSIMQYSSPQIRTLLGQDFGSLSAETNSVNLQSNMVHHPQHQHSFLGGGFGSAEAVSTVGREPESQPLRHFFDDWPRSKDASALSWSDVEDDKPNRNSSTTQLSISIPVSSSEFNTSPPPGKLKLSPLKLSMSRAGEEDIPLGVELGVGMGLGVNEDRHRQQQANWIPIAWETPMGGPLAEVLQSSTPRAGKNSGLNLMTEGWGESPRDSPQLTSSPREREVGGRATAVTVMDASSKGVE